MTRRRVRAALVSAQVAVALAVREVVGVAPDVITRVAVTEPLVIYYPAAQSRLRTWPQRMIVMRARTDAAPAMRAAMHAVQEIDPRVEPGPFLTIEAQLEQQMPAQRLGRFVLGALAILAVSLVVGLRPAVDAAPVDPARTLRSE